MTDIKVKAGIHPSDTALAAFLDKTLTPEERHSCEEHLAGCTECLAKIVSAYESVNSSGQKGGGRRKVDFMKKINIYLVLAAAAFVLSFITPRYFLQLLVATLLLGAKWIADSKSTRMLIMIYEAWKKGGEKEASRILKTLDQRSNSRF